MSDPTQGLPPAGWYPDPAGLPQQRWWDGRAWTENLQPSAELIAPAPVSQPISASEPTFFPFDSISPSQPTQESSAQGSRRAQKSEEPVPDDSAKPAGRRHFLALLVIGLITSVGGLALFSYGVYGSPDAASALQNQLYGGVVAGFGAFAMLLWLAAGAIRHR